MKGFGTRWPAGDIQAAVDNAEKAAKAIVIGRIAEVGSRLADLAECGRTRKAIRRNCPKRSACAGTIDVLKLATDIVVSTVDLLLNSASFHRAPCGRWTMP
jgi:hypothetical protein